MTVHEFGKDNKDVLVMFHPLGVWWDVFEYVIPELSERSMPTHYVRTGTHIEYWYGEDEKTARKWDIE